jgi:hypothetical protein
LQPLRILYCDKCNFYSDVFKINCTNIIVSLEQSTFSSSCPTLSTDSYYYYHNHYHLNPLLFYFNSNLTFILRCYSWLATMKTMGYKIFAFLNFHKLKQLTNSKEQNPSCSASQEISHPKSQFHILMILSTPVLSQMNPSECPPGLLPLYFLLKWNNTKFKLILIPHTPKEKILKHL